jgi:hypothetical protein
MGDEALLLAWAGGICTHLRTCHESFERLVRFGGGATVALLLPSNHGDRQLARRLIAYCCLS